MPRHSERLAAELRRLAAEYLGREAGPRSLLTVTDCALAPNGRRATILLSVLPESEEKAALAFARRQTADLVRYLRERLRVRHLPQLVFQIDEGEKHRQKIDKLLEA